MRLSEETKTGTDEQLSAGELLRKQREELQLSLEDAAAKTRVAIDQLHALETGNTGYFASPAHLKGFVRVYTSFLGLDYSDILTRFGHSPAKASVISGVETPMPKKNWNIGIPVQKLIIPAILLVLILVTNSIINKENSSTSKPTLHSSASAAKPVTPRISSAIMPISGDRKNLSEESEQTKPPDTDLEQKEQLIVTVPGALKPETQSKSFVLSIVALKNTTITITVDSETPEEHELVAGDRIEWQGEKNIRLELPDAGAVEGSKNGKPLPKFGEDGARKTVLIRNE